MALMVASASLGASGGAFIWILPFPPVVIGTGSYPAWAVAVGVAVTVLGVALFVALRRRERTGV